MYEIVGEGSATFFFSIDESGQVSVKESLEADRATQYKISVVAFGSCDPSLRDYASVSVSVVRNAHAPTFGGEEFSVSVSESEANGSTVFVAEADDEDSVSTRVLLNIQLAYYVTLIVHNDRDRPVS